MTGMPPPSAVVANVVTGVSSTPIAILDMVLAVAGAMSIRSHLSGTSPQNETCWTLPSISVVTGLPEANSSAHGWMIVWASLDMTTWTSAPCLMSSLHSLTHSTAAMLPVTPSTILRPLSLSLLVPLRWSAGCM